MSDEKGINHQVMSDDNSYSLDPGQDGRSSGVDEYGYDAFGCTLALSNSLSLYNEQYKVPVKKLVSKQSFLFNNFIALWFSEPQ